MNIRKQFGRYKTILSYTIGIVALGVLLVIFSSTSPRESKRSVVQTSVVDSGNYGMNVNNRVDRVTFTLDSRSSSIIRSSMNTIPSMRTANCHKREVAVPLNLIHNSSMLSMKEMTVNESANLQVEVVLNIRKLAEDAMKRNPGMSSGGVVELILEGIEQDVFDGWDPDADK